MKKSYTNTSVETRREGFHNGDQLDIVSYHFLLLFGFELIFEAIQFVGDGL